MTSSGIETVLTVDLGTSGPKVAVFTIDGRFIDGDFVAVETLLGPDGMAEQRPDDWWKGIVEGCGRMRGRGSLDPRTVAAVSVTSQWSGTVPVDEGLRPLHNAITWMDSRGAAAVRRRFGGPVGGFHPLKLRTFIKFTGGAPSLSGKDPMGHILWFEQEWHRKAAATRWYLEPKDWINARLTGRVCATYDSIALHWVTDNRVPERVEYCPELLSMAGIDRGKLPSLVPATSVIGGLEAGAAADLGLPSGTPVVGGTPDVQSATLGSGAVGDYDAHLYIGTSSWLTCHVPNKATDLRSGIASLPSALPGRYFVADEQESAGGCLNWLRDQVFFTDDLWGTSPPDSFYESLDRLAGSSPPGCNGVIFTPWLNGERTPVDDHALRAGWHHLSLRSNRADMVRSVLEGVAMNGRWLLGTVERFVGRSLPSLAFVGGGARSALWSQIHADVMGREIRRIEDPVRANARGAAMVAAVALGRSTVDEFAASTPVAAVHHPDPGLRSRYDAMYAEFRSIHRQTRGIDRRLSTLEAGPVGRGSRGSVGGVR